MVYYIQTTIDKMNNLSNKYYIRYFSIFFGLLFLLGFIFLIARVQRGYSAIILSISAILLFVYWSNEIKKNMRNLPYLGVLNKQKKFGYEFISNNDEILFIANIPGDHETIFSSINGNTLFLKSKSGLNEKINLSQTLIILDSNFVNGILNIKLKKSQT